MEAMLLAAGAAHVTTLGYSPIANDHPQITTMRHTEFNARYLNGSLEKFDGAATFSSLGHAGLGRYGDKLNPYGDLVAMAKIW